MFMLQSNPRSHTGLLSVVSVIILPLTSGPLLATMFYLSRICIQSYSFKITEEFCQNWMCIALLTIVFVVTYSVNMIISEIMFDEVSVMMFILMKYSFGSLQNLFSPLAIIISYPETRNFLVKKDQKGRKNRPPLESSLLRKGTQWLFSKMNKFLSNNKIFWGHPVWIISKKIAFSHGYSSYLFSI